MAVKIPRKEWPTPEIDEKRCSACSMCIGVCRFQALGISLAYAYGEIGASACLKNAKACVGCGLCSQECPLNCIRMVVVS